MCIHFVCSIHTYESAYIEYECVYICVYMKISICIYEYK